MRKKFKTKRIFKHRKIFLIFLILIIFYVVSTGISNIKFVNSKKIIVDNLLSNNIKINKDINIFNKFYKKVNAIVFNEPISILEMQLGYKYKKNKSDKIETVVLDEKIPRIYIYNSHQGEQYSYKYLESYNIIPDVLMASLMLKEKLENLSISTIVEESDILEYMKKNNLNHAGSYIASKHFLNETIKKYDNLDLYIDLHRDAAVHSVTHTNINGKDCAKVLFVIGLENPNYQFNLDVVTKINNIILEKYPTLTRGIMKKEGYGVNGVYNQDLHHNVILLEVGGHQNNIDEINNTLDLIAEVIGEYLNEKEEKE